MVCVVRQQDEIAGLQGSRVELIIDAQPALTARDHMEIGMTITRSINREVAAILPCEKDMSLGLQVLKQRGEGIHLFRVLYDLTY